MRVTYTGSAPVRVPEAGGRLVEPGKSIEVPAALGRRLVKSEHWRAPTRRRRSATTTEQETDRG